jgi:hypothetical protein
LCSTCALDSTATPVATSSVLRRTGTGFVGTGTSDHRPLVLDDDVGTAAAADAAPSVPSLGSYYTSESEAGDGGGGGGAGANDVSSATGAFATPGPPALASRIVDLKSGGGAGEPARVAGSASRTSVSTDTDQFFDADTDGA